LRIDAHQHFWTLERTDYGWLTPGMGAIYRDFLPEELAPQLEKHNIEGCILVQAAPTIDETDYMLGLAGAHSFVKGVVGWVDFESDCALRDIARLAAHPKLVGLRPMIQDIPDDDWMLKPDLDAAFKALISEDLTFDALTFPRHLKNLQVLLTRYPQMRVVIDHASKPQIRDRAFDVWSEDMAEIAADTDACCKISGLVTEACKNWGVDDIRPYVDHLLQTFGPDRLIWGSDWPVLTLAADYDRWVDTSNTLLDGLSPAELEAIFGGTAARAYRLDI
jgi:L-fuconolactonase